MLLKKIGAHKRFRDPIYGFIYLTENEVQIVDSLLFQRLRRIHQLALTKYVYPAAEHSRFVHSLGVLHTATRLFIEIFNNQSTLRAFSRAQDQDGDVDEEIISQFKILRYAALLHDIGHVPFSHACESIFLGDKFKHEDVSRYIIENYKPISDVIKSDNISPKIVSSLLTDTPTKKYSIIQKIVSGQLDADRADYLLRDSHACGVKYGEYDYDRFINSLFITEDDEIRLNIDERDIYVVESFLLARYHYNIQVPYHRTRVGYNIVLKNFINGIPPDHNIFHAIQVKNNKLEIDFDLFEFLDDYSLFELIKLESRKENPWAIMLLRQEHLIPVYDRPKTNEEDDFIFKLILQHLTKAGLTEGEDYFKYTDSLRVSKLVNKDSDVKKVPAKTIYVRSKKDPDLCEDIVQFSAIISQLAKAHTISRIYAPPGKDERVQRAVNEKLDEILKARRQ